jgi:MFS transporter, AAHS family, 4-hydroxybenzoate transporter
MSAQAPARGPTGPDLAAAIDDRKLGRFGLGLVLISALVIFFDGYDMQVIAFATTRMEKVFHVTNAGFGLALGAGLFGTLVGGILFGALGDRYGRRPAIIAATACFSILTFALAFADNLWALIWLRFFAGLALGGAIPLLWTLNVEFAPRRLRATVITLIMLGYGFGSAFAGPISTVILPRWDWPGLFLFGGVVSLIAVAILIAWLPESLRTLAAREGNQDAIVKILRRMGVETPIDPEAVRILREGPPGSDDAAIRSDGRSRLVNFLTALWRAAACLFNGRLLILTPLIWICYFASSMAVYFLTNWGPTILRNMHFDTTATGWLSFGNSMCGMTGGLLLMRFTDKHGPISIAAMPLTAVPLLLVTGLAQVSLPQFVFLSLALTFFVSGGHYGITSVISGFYPTHIRASASGLANAFAKVGSILGPVVGGFILDAHLAPRTPYALLAVCPLIFGVAAVAMGLADRRGGRPAEVAAQPVAAE